MAENLENTQSIELDPNEVTIEVDDSQQDTKPRTSAGSAGAGDDLTGDNDSSDRERKRLERQQRLKRQRDARARNQEELRESREEVEMLKAEIASMKNQYSQFSTQASNFYKTQLEERITTSQQLLAWYNNQLADAVSTSDGTKVAEMNALIEQERSKLSTYAREKQNFDQPQNQGNQNDPQVALFNQRKQRHQQKFVSDNADWFNDPAFTSERRIAESLDQQLANERLYTPDQPEYWQELNYRIKSHPRLKDIVNDDYGDSMNQAQHTRNQTAQKPITSGSGSSGGTGTPGKVRLKFEPHHIEGLKFQGIMDDSGRIIKGEEQRAIKYYENIMRIRNESGNR